MDFHAFTFSQEVCNFVIYGQPLLYKLVCQTGVRGNVHTPVVVSEAVGQLHVAAEAVRVPTDHVS